MPLLMCPNDNSPMQEIDRNGVLIDVCPTCRGVWMDRGELEKLMELVGRPAGGERGPDRQGGYDDRRDRDDRGRDEDRRYEDERRPKRRKRFELFDFFD